MEEKEEEVVDDVEGVIVIETVVLGVMDVGVVGVAVVVNKTLDSDVVDSEMSVGDVLSIGNSEVRNEVETVVLEE